jgi:ABC-2 type transport system ATP-binding protein
LPDSGEVKLFGEPFKRDHLKRVGYLPETSGLYKKMKVGEQLSFLGQLRGLSAEEADRRSREWCERMEIPGQMEKKTDELSKGMQQKIQFIATLLHEPEFIIMDEPFSGLDPVNSGLLKDVLLEQKKLGRTILFSTHRMDQVEKLCDNICLINKGQAVLRGSVRDIKRSYGKNNVAIEYEGNDEFLRQGELVQSFDNYGNYVEVRMVPGADAQKLLRAAAERSKVTRFELVEPSLDDIFKQVVGKADA